MAMNQRVERLAGEIRQVLGEILARQEIKDPRVQEAGLITLTHVRLTGDLREATALFTVHGANKAKLTRVMRGLNHASGYLKRRLGRELSVRAIPSVTFQIDQVFDQEEKVDALLRQIQQETPVAASAEDGEGDGSRDGSGDGDEGNADKGQGG
jgi:ribosome-binding factor A